MSARDPALDLFAMMTVLGLRDDADRPAATEAEIEEAVAHWAEAFAPMTAIAAPAAAPQELWARIEASLAGERRVAQAAAEPEARPSLAARLWRSVGLWRFATAAAVAAAVMLAVFGRPLVGPTAGPAYVAVLQAPEGERRAGFVVEVAADRSVRLIPLGRTEAGAEKSLQFWTLADKARGPLSLGLVPGDRPTSVPAEALPSIVGGQLFEVTLEPYGGSTTGRPTGPILYKGLAERL